MEKSSFSGTGSSVDYRQEFAYLPAAESNIAQQPNKKFPLVERVLYHAFVGLFLATIPVLWIAIATTFSTPHRGAILVGAWVMLGAAYAHWRVKRERMPMRPGTVQGGWWPFLRAVPYFLLNGCVIGFVTDMGFHRAPAGFILGGGAIALTLMGMLHLSRLRLVASKTDENERVIESWVLDGVDEADRGRRRAYAASGAFLTGAAAAGVAEYEGAPILEWLSIPEYPLYHCYYDDGELMSTLINPATGLPMIDGIDSMGNVCGSGD